MGASSLKIPGKPAGDLQSSIGAAAPEAEPTVTAESAATAAVSVAVAAAAPPPASAVRRSWLFCRRFWRLVVVLIGTLQLVLPWAAAVSAIALEPPTSRPREQQHCSGGFAAAALALNVVDTQATVAAARLATLVAATSGGSGAEALAAAV